MDGRYWHQRRRTVTRRRVLGTLTTAATGAAAIGAVGCGDDDDDDSTPAGTGTATSTSATGSATATASAAVKVGGTLKCSEATGTDHFDPAIIVHAGSMGLGTTVVYAGLLRVREGLVVEGYMADMPEQPDPLSYVFKLKPGINWQNLPPLNGRAFTAKDAIFGLQRFTEKNTEFVYGANFSPVDKWEAVDDSTFKLTLSKPHAPLLTSIASDWAMIVSQDQRDKVGDAGIKKYENMVGTGPFLPGQLVQGASNFVTKNPNFFIKGQPYLDRIEYTVVGDSAARIAAIRGGQFHLHALWGGHGKTEADQIKGLLGDSFVVTPKPNMSWIPISPNSQVKPFDDVRVRKALHLALNRQAIVAASAGANQLSVAVNRGLADYAMPLDVLATLPGYRENKTEDLAEAKKLLAAAGHPNGFQMTIRSFTGYAQATVAQASFKEIGVDVTVQEANPVEILAERASGRFTFVVGATGGGLDVDSFTYNFHHTSSPNNFGKFSDPKVDSLCEAQRQTLNIEERKKIVRELENLLLEHNPTLYSVSPTSFAGQRSAVKNRRVTPAFQQWLAAEIWLDES